MHQDDNTNCGIRICEHASCGRVMEANKDFAVGEEILSEKPFVTFRDNVDLIRKVLLMSDDNQEVFFDFHHLQTLDGEEVAPECAESYRPHWADAQRLAVARNGIALLVGSEKVSQTFFFKILTVASMNSHRFYGQHNAAFADIVGGTCHEGACAALFQLGSKVTHSCRPNCMYSSKRKPGHGDYIAILPICNGDLITFNYVSTHTASTETRRDQLLRQKNFFCMCDKCVRPDYNRGIACEKCKATPSSSSASSLPSVKLCVREDSVSSPLWTCLCCGDDDTPRNLRHEGIVNAWMTSFKASIASGVQPQHIADVREQVEVAEKQLCRTHHLVLELYSTLSMVAASVAVCLEQGLPILSEKYRVISMVASCDFIQIVECMAAECLRGAECTASHPPQADAVQQVLWSCMDAQKCGSNVKDTCPTVLRCLDLAAKYRSQLIVTYGGQDEDVHCILRMMVYQRKNSSSLAARGFTTTTVGSVSSSALSSCANPICVELNCGNSPLLKCAQCLAVAYCCVSSQRAHWKLHKKICKQKKQKK